MTHEKRLNAHITKVVLSSKSEVVSLGILDLIHWISCFRHSHLYLSKDHIVITLRRSQAHVRSVLFKLREVCMCSYSRLARYFRKMVFTCFEEAYSSLTWSPLRVIHVWWRNSISGPCSRGCSARLDISYWPRGRPLCNPCRPVVSRYLKMLSLEVCFLPCEVRLCPSKVCGLPNEVCCFAHLSCDFTSYFSLRKSLQVPHFGPLSHIGLLGTQDPLYFALVCYFHVVPFSIWGLK